MLILYHGGTAVCAAKVRLTLAEKNIAWEGVLLDLGNGDQFKPDYLKLNPNGVVPTVVHDGKVVIESTVINEYLDTVFPGTPLRPQDPWRQACMRLWTKREDGVHAAINTMTTAILFRPDLLEKSEAERSARIDGIPDPIRRAKWYEILESGMESHAVLDAFILFARQFRDMERALAEGPWLMGEAFTLADSGLVSFFYRLELLGLDFMWNDHNPRLTDWYMRCKARPSFQTSIADFIGPSVVAHYRERAGAAAAQARASHERALQQVGKS